MRSYIITDAEREALLRYIGGQDINATSTVRGILHRYRKNKQRYREDLDLLRTAEEDRLPHIK
jgi:hypothetical protein